MRTITILLTEYTDWISRLVCRVGGHGYTHASLSLEEDANLYYSFNYRGFCTETLEKHRRRGVKKSLSYQLAVSDQAYRKLKVSIGEFQRARTRLRFTRLGVLCCALRIPFRWKQHYFCSQFVAEVLITSGAVRLHRPPTLYLPNQFCRELSASEQVLSVRHNPI